MKLTEKIEAMAERRVELTMEEAGRLKGMLKRIVPACLACHGFYTCNLDGVDTLFVLKKEN